MNAIVGATRVNLVNRSVLWGCVNVNHIAARVSTNDGCEHERVVPEPLDGVLERNHDLDVFEILHEQLPKQVSVDIELAVIFHGGGLDSREDEFVFVGNCHRCSGSS